MQYCLSKQDLSASRLNICCSEVLVDEAAGSGGWLRKLLEGDVVEAVAVATDAKCFGVAVLQDLVFLRRCTCSFKRPAIVLAKAAPCFASDSHDDPRPRHVFCRFIAIYWYCIIPGRCCARPARPRKARAPSWGACLCFSACSRELPHL